jgi:hypothetical protein
LSFGLAITGVRRTPHIHWFVYYLTESSLYVAVGKLAA